MVEKKINENNIVKFNPPEKERIYRYSGKEYIKLKNVTELYISKSGNHRVKTKDGFLHIIPNGWIHIKIKAKEWTV